MRSRRFVSGLLVCVFGAGCGRSAPPPAGRAVTRRIGVEHVTFANGTRTLPTTIWRPAGSGPFPLVVFGPGRNSRPEHYDALLRRWVSAGFEVAGPKSPNTDYDLVGHDLHAVIESMVHRPEVDGGRVAVAGQSLGAIHAMAVARNSCCRDDHVRAALIFAGTAREFAGSDWLAKAPPTLFMHGDHDNAVPYANGHSAYRFWPAPKFFVTLKGARHTEPFANPLSGAIDEVVARTTTDFLRWTLLSDAAAHDDFERALARTSVAAFEEQPFG